MVLRDLEEMAGAERSRRSRSGMRVWLWRQVLSFCLRFVTERVRETLGRAIGVGHHKTGRWWSALDVRYAARTLARAPVVSVAAVLCLALGIALPVAGFGVMNALFFASLPYPESDRIVRLRDVHARGRYELDLTAAEYERRRDRLSLYDVVAAYDLEQIDVALEGGASLGLLSGARVTPDLFELARTPARIGRVFEPEDASTGAGAVALVGELLWRRSLGGDASIIGRTIVVKGRPHTVIGVMPERFGFPGDRVEVWLPLSTRSPEIAAASAGLKVAGRLRAGATLEQAEAELRTVLPTERTDVASDDVVIADVTPFARGSVAPQAVGFGLAMVGGLVVLLVIAAANVANLMLARNAARIGELAVRTALGASRGRLITQLFLEAMMLSVPAVVLGAMLARFALVKLQPALALPASSRLALDGRVLLFAAVLALTSALVAGLGPAWKATRQAAHGALKTVGRGGDTIGFGRLSGALIVIELCLSVALLGVAGVFARGMFEFGRTGVVLSAENVLVAQLYWGAPPELRGGQSLNDAERRAAWAAHGRKAARDQALIASALASDPAIRTVTYASHVPGMPLAPSTIEIEGDGDATVFTATRIASIRPAFFEVLDVQLVAGRDFRAADVEAGASSVIINESFARRHFGSVLAALGRRIRPQGNDAQSSSGAPAAWLEVIGVAPDLGLNPGDPANADGVYLPLGEINVAELIVHARDGAQTALPLVLGVVRDVSRDVEVQWTTTLAESIRLPARIFRGVAAGFVVAGIIALVLSMLSLYALLAFSVTRRMREIGIRMAIGAPTRSVLGTVLGRGLRQLLLGATLGALIGIVLARLAVATIPFDLMRGGPIELIATALLFTIAGAIACLRPVRRVLSLDAMHAMRID
jgi:predicted permease